MSDALIHGAFWIALLFSVFAGMTTSVGALVAVLPRATNHRFTGMAVGFSAGALLLLALGQALPTGPTIAIVAVAEVILAAVTSWLRSVSRPGHSSRAEVRYDEPSQV
jgi:zinc transporter ZupT